MKQPQKPLDQSQRVFPISPQDSNYNLNSHFFNKTTENGFKKTQQSNQIYNPNDLIPDKNDSISNILYQIQLSVNRQGEMKEDLTKRAQEKFQKVDSHLEQLVDQMKSNDEQSNASSDSDKNMSSFVKKFRNITWYKLIYLVSEALQRWKGTLKANRIQNSTQHQLDMINDKSFYQTDWNRQMRIEMKPRKSKTIDYNQSKFIRRLKKKTRFIRRYIREFYLKVLEFSQFLYVRTVKVLRIIPIFDPLDNIVLFWESLYLLFCIFLFVYLPFSVSFEQERALIISGGGWILLIVFLGIDLLKNLNTAVYVKGELIKQHLLIFKEYVYSLELPLDILTYFSAIGVLQFNYSRAIFLLRIFYKPNLVQKFKDAFQMSEKQIATVDLLKLFASVLYLCHIVACVWHKIGEIQQEFDSGWIVKNQFQNESVFTRYVNSYFFSIIMMSSVKGNIQPNTNAEKIFTTLIAFGACVLFGYTITSITIILRNLNTKWDNFNMLVSETSKYMRRYNVDLSYQSRARKYIEYVKDASLEEKRKSSSVLNCLSKQLKDDIFINIYQQSLHKIPFFQNHFSQDCINQLALRMQSSFFASDDVIISRQQISDPAIYFIIEGEVIEYYYSNNDLQVSDNHQVIREKKKGEIIGLYEFSTQNYQPLCYAKSRGVTELHFLKLKDFLEIVAKFPEEREHYYNMKDQLMINRKTKYIEVECSLCYEKDHIEQDCNMTFYEQRKRLINLKYGIVPGQQSKVEEIERKLLSLRYHSLSGQKKIQQDINQFREQALNEKDIYQYTLHNDEDIDHHHHNDHHHIDNYHNNNNDHQLNHENLNKKKQVKEKKQDKNQNQSSDNAKNERQSKREQKILNIINQFNQDKMHNLQNEFMLNFLSPVASDAQQEGYSDMILIDHQDQNIYLDQDDLNLLSPSKLEDTSIFAQKSKDKNSSIQISSNNYLKKKDNVVNTDDEDNQQQGTHSTIQTYTPKEGELIKQTNKNSNNPNYLLKNNFMVQNQNQEQGNEQNNTHTFTVNQDYTTNIKSHFHEKLSIYITNGDDTSKSTRAKALQNRRQKSFKKQAFSEEEETKIANFVSTPHNLQISQEFRQQIQQISNKNDSRKPTLNLITERSVGPASETKMLNSIVEQENVSIDFSSIFNFKYYFPHNNFQSIFKVKGSNNKANQRRSVINPLLHSLKDKSFISKKSQK